MGANSVLTPYLNLDYVNVKMDEFIESGLAGADLHLDTNREKRTFLTAGVKWATQMGGVVPEVNLGYRHRFGDRFSTQRGVPARPTPRGVRNVSATRSASHRDGSASAADGPVDLRSLRGEFNSDVRSHSVTSRCVAAGRKAVAPPSISGSAAAAASYGDQTERTVR